MGQNAKERTLVYLKPDAIQRQLQETGGIVAVFTFGVRRRVKLGFTDGRYAIMAFTAMSKNFQVISVAGKRKPEGGMTGLAHITGGDVIRWFILHRFKTTTVTICANSCIWCVIANSGEA